jgi:hypothetical protein
VFFAGGVGQAKKSVLGAFAGLSQQGTDVSRRRRGGASLADFVEAGASRLGKVSTASDRHNVPKAKQFAEIEFRHFTTPPTKAASLSENPIPRQSTGAMV